MERNNNYNRGGNDGGYRGGGRGNGGRGGGGRGGGGGGYHRGGRNGNYSQQYSNQQQEQYQESYGGGRGRGRGRESGGIGSGRGRGQQSQQAPANPRQNADRVPEVNAWSRVASGQPAVPQTQTLTQNRNDRQVEEVSSKLSTVSVTDHSKDDVTNAYLPIKRPDRGTLAMRSVKLLVNHFPVKFDPSNTILRYDIDIKHAVEQEASSSTRALKKSIPKSSLRQIQEKLCSEYPDRIPLLQTGYDGEKNIFSAVVLQAGAYSVQVGGRSYVCTIKFGNELNLSKLQDFLNEHLREIQQVNDITRNRNKVMAALKRLKVTVTHRRTKQRYTVFGLSEKLTKDISFVQEDLEGKKAPQVVMLTDYFREKWGKEIMHKGIPCLQLGTEKKPNLVPMEFCVLDEDRRFPKEQLGKEAARMLKNLSLLAPDVRRKEICGIVHEEFGTGTHGAEVIKNFEVGVGMNMTEVNGRVMEPPKLKLGGSNGKTNIVMVDKQKCHYNLLQGRTLVTGKSLERWALIDFSQRHRDWLDADSFIPKLMKRCTSLGVRMAEPLYVYNTNMRELSDVNMVRSLLKWLVEECRKFDNGRLQMIFCVMPERHDGYKSLKLVSETEIGVMTQCCLSQNANKANDQFLANLGLKINAKLEGCNVQLVDPFPHFNKDDRYMFIGADVNHPAAMNAESPSIAAVVASVDRGATRYVARVWPQEHRKEEIVNFGSVCLDLINTYATINKVKPNKIVVYRDGVSDDQFEMVLNKEMVDMKKAIYTEHYRPFVTFVVAQKRHTTRLFLNNENEIGNVPPGTVVDTNIVHTSNFDFYLCSHFGGIGTSKPTHYTVIWDEIGFSSNEIQRLTYDLCFVFARCTKPVSLVTPVYYADLLAYRGRMFQEEVKQMEDSGSAPPSSSFDRAFYNLDQNLKDSMFFI
ncbi:putative post-transcriptional gene silencing PAZ-Argonaute family [Helianthus debilis subsp. tardiflorus]